MRLLFFIDDLGAGGKQRRLIELIKGLTRFEGISMSVALTKKETLYTEINELPIEVSYALRESSRDAKVFLDFFKIVMKFKPDLIHVWGNLEAIYSIPASLLLRVPLINGQITNARAEYKNILLSHRLTFLFSKVIVANSHAGIEAYHAPKDKSRVIYNGFDFKRLNDIQNERRIKKKFEINSKYVVGMVGSFEERKDYSTYCRVINELLLVRNDITFLAIGDGDFSKYKLMIEASKLSNVRFIGHQNDVESIMNICDIGVLTTYTEGISNAVLEFMALGKPVVVSGSGGCNELVVHNENGYLFTPGDHEAVSDTINYLIDNSEKRKLFGKKSKEIVDFKFSIEKMVDSFYRLYSQVKLDN